LTGVVVAVAATPQSLGLRARVVLLSGEGDSLRAIAERLGVTQRTVCLRRRYQGEGLKSRHRSGRPRRISRRKELAVAPRPCGPPKHATHWSAQVAAQQPAMTQRNRFLLYTANDPQEPKCEVPGNPAEKIPLERGVVL
jgi:Homeodomain-like domain-containing protein